MRPGSKIALLVLILLIVAGGVAGLYLFNLKPKDLQKVKPDYVIASSDLLKAFEDDEAAAAAKYVGKIVEVSGEIGTLTSGEGNTVNIALKTGSDFSSVICTLPEGSALGNAGAGMQVAIRGECSGYLMDVLLKNCVIISK
ncbi:MAG: hypothetical protein IH593_06660 [Bacteroidales bacterium]|nr:hypothetical protein [Bacteroidales bacterium]